MSGQWQGSTRRDRLPRDWRALCTATYTQYGHVCYLCGEYASQIDHVIPGDDHELTNLRPICVRCHGRKSGREGGIARAVRYSRHRPEETHPGSLL